MGLYNVQLAEFIREKNITQAAFAGRLGVSQSAVQRYCQGRVPEPDVMARIYRETDGMVAPNDFYGLGKDAGEDLARRVQAAGEVS